MECVYTFQVGFDQAHHSTYALLDRYATVQVTDVDTEYDAIGWKTVRKGIL